MMAMVVLVISSFGLGSAVAVYLAARALASGFQHVWGADRRTDVDGGA